MPFITSGELARQASVNGETLRYYEREGLLPAPPRTESGYRMYGPEDVQRVRFIRRAQELGFSLADIRELLTLRNDTAQTVGPVKQLAQRKMQQIDEKIQALMAMKTALSGLVNACPGDQGTTPQCPILNSLDGSHTKTNPTIGGHCE